MPENIGAKIADVFNYPAAKQHMKLLVAGEELIAIREPTNPHDPNAIALYIKNREFDNKQPPVTGFDAQMKCGYVPKKVAETLKGKSFTVRKIASSFDAIVIEII